MRASSLCVVAFSVVLAQQKQIVNSPCRDIVGRHAGLNWVCAGPSLGFTTTWECDETNSLGAPPNSIASNDRNTGFATINQQSYCCNASLTAPENRFLAPPNASLTNCCPLAEVNNEIVVYTRCGKAPMVQCCHPTDQICIPPAFEGEGFGFCQNVSKAPTSPTGAPTGAPTVAPTDAPTNSPPTEAPTGAPTGSPTGSPTSSPTLELFLTIPVSINGNSISVLPVQDATGGGFVRCGCTSTCPSGSYCSFLQDTSSNIAEGYCSPGVECTANCTSEQDDVLFCASQSCSTCANSTTLNCVWYGMAGCQLNSTTRTLAIPAESACSTCPVANTGGSTSGTGSGTGEIQTGVPGTCLRRCGSLGERRFQIQNGLIRTFDITEVDPEVGDLQKFFRLPNFFNPYINMYGFGNYRPPPPPPPPRMPSPLSFSPRTCSCDDKCVETVNADCCNDYNDLCVI
jgi:hypothetical protein